jgi:hypothetical protein
MGEIGDQGLLVVVQNLGADGNLEDQVGAARPGAVLAAAGTPPGGLEMLAVAKIDEGVEAIDAFGDDIAAAAAVAAVGTAVFRA